MKLASIFLRVSSDTSKLRRVLMAESFCFRAPLFASRNFCPASTPTEGFGALFTALTMPLLKLSSSAIATFTSSSREHATSPAASTATRVRASERRITFMTVLLLQVSSEGRCLSAGHAPLGEGQEAHGN